MTYVFESKVPHLTFDLGGGKIAEFRGHYFATDKEDTAKKIQESSMFSEEPESRTIWLRIKSDDSKAVEAAQKKRGRPKRVISGAVGTST